MLAHSPGVLPECCLAMPDVLWTGMPIRRRFFPLRRLRALRVSLLLALLTTLCACSSLPAFFNPEATVSQVPGDELYQLQKWKIRGRLAVQADDEGWTAAIHWDQDRDNYRIRLIAPLGQGTYELTGDNEDVTMITADNRVLHARDPGQLLLENLGWEVRVSGLKYWIRGLPEPGIAAAQMLINDEGRISDMQQEGWRVSILRYTRVADRLLPGKMFLQNNRFSLRLVVQHWEITP